MALTHNLRTPDVSESEPRPASAALDRQAYRPDVDGLRAVAVLAVVGYHCFPSWVPGGFVGVDVFFVISGYLITGLLLRDLARSRFSYLNFYARRFRRIIPALFVVLAATWAAGWNVLLVDQYMHLGKHLLAGATFTSNFVLWKESGYFDTASALKPLLHLWSLSNEEQFYLVWPLLLGWGFRRRARLPALIGGLLLLSFALNLWRINVDSAQTFYLLPTRFWELLCGCGLGYVESRRPRWGFNPNVQSVVATLGLAIAVFAFNNSLRYPGWWAIVPCVTTVLLIAAGPGARANVVLSSKPLVLVGLISYPLYLWHWPILSLLHTHLHRWPDPALRVAVVVTSAVLAWLTWRFIERPLRTKPFAHSSSMRADLGYVCAALAMLGAVGTVGWLTSRATLVSSVQKQSLAVAGYASGREDAVPGYGQCFLGPEDSFKAFAPDCFTREGDDTMLLWGDSHALHMYPGLTRYFDAAKILRLTASSCPPVLGLSKAGRPHCREVNDFVLEQVKRIRPRVVIMEACWLADFGEKGFVDQLDTTTARLREAGAGTVIVLGQLPNWESPLFQIIERDYLSKGHPIPGRMVKGVLPKVFEIDSMLERRFANSGVIFIPLANHLCNQAGCLTMVGNNAATDLITSDNAHLTSAGSRYVVKTLIEPALSRALASRR